ncbi:hypothetical protein WJX72_009398 [[Myrmecia] bisecta]|uniref:Uncharacterized protein n=1 Tax=[Myrmecia] bisecta TaxID=41462 RepID=A0AAW1PLZ4_9CHLO
MQGLINAQQEAKAEAEKLQAVLAAQAAHEGTVAVRTAAERRVEAVATAVRVVQGEVQAGRRAELAEATATEALEQIERQLEATDNALREYLCTHQAVYDGLAASHGNVAWVGSIGRRCQNPEAAASQPAHAPHLLDIQRWTSSGMQSAPLPALHHPIPGPLKRTAGSSAMPQPDPKRPRVAPVGTAVTPAAEGEVNRIPAFLAASAALQPEASPPSAFTLHQLAMRRQLLAAL